MRIAHSLYISKKILYVNNIFYVYIIFFYFNKLLIKNLFSFNKIKENIKPVMPNYADSQIYSLRCKDDDTLIYIGSTTLSLYERLAIHKCNSKKPQYKNNKLYSKITDWSKWYIQLEQEYPCQTKEELEKQEGIFIRKMGTLNSHIAGRCIKEYNHDNKEKIANYYKVYYQNNKERYKSYNKSKKNKVAL